MNRVFAKNLRAAAGEEDEISYSGGSNDSFVGSDGDVSSEYIPSNKRLRTIKVTQGEAPKIQRKPTRVPNMKINNRNALLARENRKRKKEMMETLEKSVEDLQTENRGLHKMMKSKNMKIEMLMREVKYLKSVIANNTEIVSILKSLPQTTKNKLVSNNGTEEQHKFGSPRSTDETLSCEALDNDFVEVDNVATDWDEILSNPFNTDIPNGIEQLSPNSEISTEHNYSHYDKHFEGKNSELLPGVCLHINTGKVSLEFCYTCHHNATSKVN